VGSTVGARDGVTLGVISTLETDGDGVDSVGSELGDNVGFDEVICDKMDATGFRVGFGVGSGVGNEDGKGVGFTVGADG